MSETVVQVDAPDKVYFSCLETPGEGVLLWLLYRLVLVIVSRQIQYQVNIHSVEYGGVPGSGCWRESEWGVLDQR